MPGRKSNVSTTSNGPEEVAETTPARQPKEKDGLSVEDLSLPKSMIQRIAKGNLPANTQIHKDALLALHKSATVFVSYLAANSNDNAQASGKKTISPQDVMAALKDAELENFLPVVEAQLKKYNEIQCDKRNTYRRKVKEEKAKDAPPEGEGDAEGAASGVASKDGEVVPGANGTANGHADIEDGERPVKKLKGDAGVAMAPGADDADDEDMADDQDADANDDEEAADDDVEDEDDEDQTMEDALEEQEPEDDDDDERGELRDEALDEPDSD
ncbi:DNA polymerase epsilon subunit D [Fulvia fulva]|uniref:DNA polymerase epsilon subunit D n=1 Tax=Passalora fulva TaxID=5499 RepID=A0A9Q8L511_PASFU|nr:DNA polymerase epsilon subunit D [Fulvia fulva]KAK4634720.1 DNA polymerase epsilon subunit D [Fulvia fulva]KAK4637290.1 DNA polymerase epsilon subunit D [Fulvia fulva]UJO10909.1 DNA polymerase epsilon subunit D [Fulvia fulva]WPV10321.1 DNA polymerase epsilon subunit D [Fulvia fulva]WPV23356.1 DNA polymerase epsilon subunit D [Fulvia fulva]